MEVIVGKLIGKMSRAQKVFFSLLVICSIAMIVELGGLVFHKSSFLHALSGAVILMWEWIYGVGGIVSFVLLPMSILLIFTMVLLIAEPCREPQLREYRGALIQWCDYIEKIAPVLGFLQTLISLSLELGRVTPGIEQQTLLTGIIRAAGVAYGSSIWGMSLMIVAYTLRRLLERRALYEREVDHGE